MLASFRMASTAAGLTWIVGLSSDTARWYAAASSLSLRRAFAARRGAGAPPTAECVGAQAGR